MRKSAKTFAERDGASASCWIRLRILSTALASFILVAAGPAPTVSTPRPLEAGHRYEIGPGRSMNMVCMGTGSKTVVFDAGGSDWSSIWAMIQPEIGRSARACAYDRAGLGESRPGAEPRSPIAVVEDLHALLEAAQISGPVVLVGHSLGGFNMKLYAALYPQDVAGVVLLDPSEERTWDRSRAQMVTRYGAALAARAELLDHRFLQRLVAKFRDCATDARTNGFEPGSADFKRCTDPARPQIGPEREAQRAQVMGKSSYQATQASELASSVYGWTGDDAVYARLFRPGMLGRRPMVVITHAEEPSDDPIDKLGTEQGLMLARASAALSAAGVHRIVTGSGHYLQLDRPDAVTAAILEVLAKVGTK